MHHVVPFVQFLKNVKNAHAGVLILAKFQAQACNFTKSNTPICVFFKFFKNVQMVPNRAKHLIYHTNTKIRFFVTIKTDRTKWPNTFLKSTRKTMEQHPWLRSSNTFNLHFEMIHVH